MTAQRRTSNVDQVVERELARRLNEAEAENRAPVVKIAGNLYRLVPVKDIQTTDDPARVYDPERFLNAIGVIEASGGALKGLDIEAFLEEIMESRIQDTPNHTF